GGPYPLRLVNRLGDLLSGVLVALVLRGHPHLGGLFDDLLADRMHAAVQLRHRARALGTGLGGALELGEQLVECLHDSRLAARARSRSRVTAASMSSAPYTAEPATNVSAPASAAWAMVASEMPPSTCSQTSDPRWRAASRSARSLGMVSAMNPCPPKPGSTVMTKT